MKRKNHERRQGQTQISISIPESLLADIDRYAAADQRSRSKWIAMTLEKHVNAPKPKTQPGGGDAGDAGHVARRYIPSALPSAMLNDEAGSPAPGRY